MFGFGKIVLTGSLVFAFHAGQASALVKEGGNSIVDQNGNVVSSRLDCVEKTTLKTFARDRNLEHFYRLVKTFERMTYKEMDFNLDLCILAGGEKNISSALGVANTSEQDKERVAGWLPSYGKSKSLVFITEKFLNDIDRNQANRTEQTLSQALFREILHNTLHSKSPGLGWARRDLVVSAVFDKVLSKSKASESPVTRKEFQKFNRYLEDNGFPSGFEIDRFANNLEQRFTPRTELENFLNYLRLAAGGIHENFQMKKLMLRALLVYCPQVNYEEGLSCSDYYNKAVSHLRNGGQRIRFDYKSKNDLKLTHSMTHVMDLMRIKYALEYDISPGFFPYGSESDDIIDFQDLSSFVSSFSKGSDAIDFSERFLLMSFLNNTFLDLPQYFLGLVPFIQSGLLSYETKFSCQKGRDVKKTTVANLYSLTRVSIPNRSQSDAERRAKVDKALANELPRSFFSYKQEAELLNSLFVLQQDGCYSPLPW